MGQNYIRKILKIFPDIAGGRKNFNYFEDRVKQNLKLTNKYLKKKGVKTKNKTI